MAPRIAAALTALVALALPTTAAAVPDCVPGKTAPKVVLEGADSLEAAIVDSKGRLFYSDTTAKAVMRVERPGAPAVPLAKDVDAPGGMVFDDSGKLLVGFGDSLAGGTLGTGAPMAGILRVDPDTGAKSPYATGLAMANGLARLRDGTVFASQDLGTAIDRVGSGGKPVQRSWATLTSPNGLAVDAGEKFLFAAQTFQPAAIAKIEIARPDRITPLFSAGPADVAAGLDGMTIDSAGRLYVAANQAGEIWRVEPSGSACALARGTPQASAVALGVGSTGFAAPGLYAVGFTGELWEIPLPATGVPAAPALGATGDTRAPRIRVRRRGLRARVSCDERCTLLIRGRRRTFAAGKAWVVWARAGRFTVRAFDRAGNASKRVIRIRRHRA